ncbi:MAG: AraC family transcriptional regulator [Muribaculaceae bacterium]|nr:AraC family transcriptional regulator [Muribaculaceae bacterium]
MRNRIISSNDIYFSCLFPEDEVIEGRVPRAVIMHVISGRMEIDDHEQRIEVSAGQTVFVRRDHQVRIHKTGSGGEPYSAVSIIFDRSFLRDYFNTNVRRQDLSERYAHLYKSAIILSEDSEVRCLLISLQGYIGADELPNKTEAARIKAEVIDALLRENPELYPVLFDFNEPWKIDILEFMERNFKTDFTLDELASYTGRSRAGFKRDFAKISPLTPQKWLIRHRLEAALKMIVNDKMSVGEAYLKSGFKNRTHFIKVFKGLFGVAPSEATEDTLYRNV